MLLGRCACTQSNMKSFLVTTFLTTFAYLCVTSAVSATITTANRTLCPESEHPRPPNRVDTAARVAALRAAMQNTALTGGEPVDAYITLIADDHGTSGSDWDQRVTYISGFTGSNGYTLITADDAALWTDGRYFLQAEQQLDCNWILMKMGTTGYPLGPDWLASVLSAYSRVGAYANYLSIDTWNSYASALSAKNITMVPMDEDLVDKIWTDPSRPEKPANSLIVHEIKFTGVNYVSKLADVRAKMTASNADCLIVTVLEEVAWLFNLRGSDHSDSLFYGYALVFDSNTKSMLFINNPDAVTKSESLRQHLQLDSNGDCTDSTEGNCIELHDYAEITTNITGLPSDLKMWLDPSASHAIFSAVGQSRVIEPMVPSPIGLMKAVKNPVEQQHFFNCIMRDGASVVEFAAFLEKEIADGNHWTEISAAAKLKEFRSTYQYYRGLSFDTITAVGPNAAVIHYRPDETTDRKISTSEVYLLDSGGQYLDGTTDVTRTFHYGTPTDMEREAYTRVLMGSIDLATTVWPDGLYGSQIDARARVPLWQHGWDYNHGTGHGIGYFLSVHEGPGRINLGYNPSHAPLMEGMFFSDEPGYYEDGSFGIRLETLVGVVKADTPYNFDGKKFLAFRAATLVPFEPKLIKYELLSNKQIDWLNEFHRQCEEQTGAYLRDIRKNSLAYDWLVARTKPVSSTSSATSMTSSFVIVFMMMTLCNFLQ